MYSMKCSELINCHVIKKYGIIAAKKHIYNSYMYCFVLINLFSIKIMLIEAYRY